MEAAHEEWDKLKDLRSNIHGTLGRVRCLVAWIFSPREPGLGCRPHATLVLGMAMFGLVDRRIQS